MFDEETFRLFELTCGDMRLIPIPEIDAISDVVSVAKMGSPPGGDGKAKARGYTVDRTMFREVLLRRLEEVGLISYGKALRNYDITDSGVAAHFTDGTTASGTLIIGADGAHSVVRKQYLPDHKHEDTQGRCTYGKTHITPELLRVLNPSVTKGMSAVKDRSRDSVMTMVLEPVIFSARDQAAEAGYECPPDYLYWVLACHQDVMNTPNGQHGIPRLSAIECEALALKPISAWHPSTRCIVEHQEPNQTSFLPIFSCPPSGLSPWKPSAHVTLLGDAIHLTGPSGSGAITALKDAGLLCRLLVEKGVSEETIAEYETTMREYAGQTLNLSWKIWRTVFGATERDRNIGEIMMELRSKR